MVKIQKYSLPFLAALALVSIQKVEAEEFWSYKRPLLNKLDSKNPEQRDFISAWKLYCEYDYNRSYTAFINGAKKYPQSAYFNFGIAAILFQKEDYKRALPYVQGAVLKNPKFIDAYKLRGIIYSALEKPEPALKDFSKVAQAYPGLAEVYRLKGMAELECNHFPQARADLNKGLKLAPNDPSLLFLKATIAYWDGKYKDCINVLNSAMPFSDEHPYLLRALAWAHLNQFEEAQKDLQRGAEIGRYEYVGKSDTVEDLKYDRINAEKDPARLWALACSAPLFTQNRDGLRSLSGAVPTKKEIQKEKELLAEWWGINNRQELIDMVVAHTDNGHNQRWLELKEKLKSSGGRPLPAGVDPGKAKLVRQYGEQFGQRGILAWDLSRNVALCRWGYRCGYLGKEEAFNMIMPQARRIQKTYLSWKQFAEEYYVGRQFWNEKIYQEEKSRTELNLHQLLNDPDSPWCKLAWNTPLGN